MAPRMGRVVVPAPFDTPGLGGSAVPASWGPFDSILTFQAHSAASWGCNGATLPASSPLYFIFLHRSFVGNFAAMVKFSTKCSSADVCDIFITLTSALLPASAFYVSFFSLPHFLLSMQRKEKRKQKSSPNPLKMSACRQMTLRDWTPSVPLQRSVARRWERASVEVI